ncbi:MAG: hypothetical protein H0X37_04355 [Herpetosiphonaceae bacterium]|nr:hypothetical protein [Herpetosiphonaceae bacterium]
MTKDIVRRLYIYAAAFLGLQLLLAGARGVLDVVIEQMSASSAVGQPGQFTASLTLSLALVICGLPLWAGHWWWAQRSIRVPQERASALRRLYGYLVMLIAMLGLLFELQALVGLLLVPQEGALLQPLIGTLLLNGGVWGYHWHILRKDRQEVEQAGESATLRRWYAFIVQVVSLGLASYAAASLVDQLLQLLLAAPIGTNSAVGQSVAGLIAGLGVWLPHHMWTRSLIRRDTPLRPDEARSTLRQVYEALIITVAAVAALGSLTSLLYELLLVVFGTGAWHSILVDHTLEFAIALVGSVVWGYHRSQLLGDARLATAARIETAQRISGYLTAAIGLGALFFGIGGLFGTLLRLLLTPDTIGTGWRDAISLNLALSIVALPVYGWAARGMERKARSSMDEEHTLARRIYLYAVLLFGIVATITAVVVLVRLGLGVALGNAEVGWTSEFARWLGYAVVAGVIAGMYTTLLLRSSRVRADVRFTRSIVIVANEPLRTTLTTAITRELPGATLRTVSEDEAAPLREALAGAETLIAPLRALLHGPTAPVIHNFAGQRLLLTTAAPSYEVIGRQSDEALARGVLLALEAKVEQNPSTTAPITAVGGVA